MNPILYGGEPPLVTNDNQMEALNGGNDLQNVDRASEDEGVIQSGHGYCYFVTVSAFDFAAYSRQHQKVLLWTAKMSVPAEGSSMAQVMPTLIASAAPLFGRETVGIKSITTPEVEGHVDFGEIKVKGYAPPLPALRPRIKTAPILRRRMACE